MVSHQAVIPAQVERVPTVPGFLRKHGGTRPGEGLRSGGPAASQAPSGDADLPWTSAAPRLGVPQLHPNPAPPRRPPTHCSALPHAPEIETQVPSKQGGASKDIYQETKSQSFAEQNHKISELEGALEVTQGDPFNLLKETGSETSLTGRVAALGHIAGLQDWGDCLSHPTLSPRTEVFKFVLLLRFVYRWVN